MDGGGGGMGPQQQHAATQQLLRPQPLHAAPQQQHLAIGGAAPTGAAGGGGGGAEAEVDLTNLGRDEQHSSAVCVALGLSVVLVFVLLFNLDTILEGSSSQLASSGLHSTAAAAERERREGLTAAKSIYSSATTTSFGSRYGSASPRSDVYRYTAGTPSASRAEAISAAAEAESEEAAAEEDVGSHAGPMAPLSSYLLQFEGRSARRAPVLLGMDRARKYSLHFNSEFFFFVFDPTRDQQQEQQQQQGILFPEAVSGSEAAREAATSASSSSSSPSSSTFSAAAAAAHARGGSSDAADLSNEAAPSFSFSTLPSFSPASPAFSSSTSPSSGPSSDTSSSSSSSASPSSLFSAYSFPSSSSPVSAGSAPLSATSPSSSFPFSSRTLSLVTSGAAGVYLYTTRTIFQSIRLALLRIHLHVSSALAPAAGAPFSLSFLPTPLAAALSPLWRVFIDRDLYLSGLDVRDTRKLHFQGAAPLYKLPVQRGLQMPAAGKNMGAAGGSSAGASAPQNPEGDDRDAGVPWCTYTATFQLRFQPGLGRSAREADDATAGEIFYKAIKNGGVMRQAAWAAPPGGQAAVADYGEDVEEDETDVDNLLQQQQLPSRRLQAEDAGGGDGQAGNSETAANEKKAEGDQQPSTHAVSGAGEAAAGAAVGEGEDGKAARHADGGTGTAAAQANGSGSKHKGRGSKRRRSRKGSSSNRGRKETGGRMNTTGTRAPNVEARSRNSSIDNPAAPVSGAVSSSPFSTSSSSSSTSSDARLMRAAGASAFSTKEGGNQHRELAPAEDEVFGGKGGVTGKMVEGGLSHASLRTAAAFSAGHAPAAQERAILARATAAAAPPPSPASVADREGDTAGEAGAEISQKQWTHVVKRQATEDSAGVASAALDKYAASAPTSSRLLSSPTPGDNKSSQTSDSSAPDEVGIKGGREKSKQWQATKGEQQQLQATTEREQQRREASDGQLGMSEEQQQSDAGWQREFETQQQQQQRDESGEVGKARRKKTHLLDRVEGRESKENGGGWMRRSMQQRWNMGRMLLAPSDFLSEMQTPEDFFAWQQQQQHHQHLLPNEEEREGHATEFEERGGSGSVGGEGVGEEEGVRTTWGDSIFSNRRRRRHGGKGGVSHGRRRQSGERGGSGFLYFEEDAEDSAEEEQEAEEEEEELEEIGEEAADHVDTGFTAAEGEGGENEEGEDEEDEDEAVGENDAGEDEGARRGGGGATAGAAAAGSAAAGGGAGAAGGRRRDEGNAEVGEGGVLSRKYQRLPDLYGELISSDCGFYIFFKAWEVDYVRLASHITSLTLIFNMKTLLEMRLFWKQMQDTQGAGTAAAAGSTAAAALLHRVSVLGIAWLAAADVFEAVAILRVALLLQIMMPYFFILVMFKFVLFGALEVRYMLTVWNAHQQLQHPPGNEALGRATMRLYKSFYGSLALLALFVYHIFPLCPLLCSPLYFFWVPQIVWDVWRGQRSSLDLRFVAGISLCRLVFPAYFFACPANLFVDAFVGSHAPSFFALGLIVFILLAQVLLMLGQRRFGSRFFVPLEWLPHVYNYHRPLPSFFEEDAEGGLPECAICMNPVDGKSRNRSITPCDHLFHDKCLQQWMEVKMECPNCRGVLPPFP